jgi:iron complex outermembrane receptor protein
MRLGVLATAVSLCLVGLCTAQTSHASIRKDLNVPAEELSPALQTVGTTYNLQVLYPTAIVKDLKTQGASGSLTPEEALTKVLAGTGLSYKYLDANTVTLFATAASAVAATAAGQDQANSTQDNSKEAGKKTSQEFRVAQMDQGSDSSPSTVEKKDEQASNKKPQIEEVIVTGSRIKRAAEAETVENVQVVTAQEMQKSGQETVADYLRTISSNFGNSFNESFSNSFAPGAAMAGLRGLSGKDTLILINGRRITNYGLFQNLSDSFVDLNVIPLAAIERIEILKSGGSAIYGSDAVAGVINIILRENTTERALDVGGRLTTEGGAAERDANVQAGFGEFASQGYNIFATASVYKRDQLLFSQRDNTESQNYTGLPDGSNQWHLANQYPSVPGAFPTCGTNGLPGRVQPNGYLGYGPGCYYNDASQLPLLPGAQRANLTATGNLRLADSWTGYSDLFYSNEETRSNYTPATLDQYSFVVNPATGGASSISNILPANSPYSLNGQPTPINYAFQSVGGRAEEIVSNTYRITVGIKGTWAGWDIDGGYGHSENHVSVEQHNAINAANLVAEIANGSFDFLDPALTPAANDALRITDTYASVAKLDTLDLKGSAALFNLPGGPAKMAIGAEARHESVDDQPGPAAAAGLVFNTGSTRVVGSRDIYSAFGEFDFPVLPSLDADIAAREEHYSDVGNNLRPQVTLRWQPLREITMRGVYADGFRAPSLAEASNSFSVAHQTVANPLNPAQQISLGYVTGGNPLVKPETSKNVDLGIVFSPTSNFDISADYYDIFLYRVISPNASAQQIVDDPAAYPGQLITAPDGAILYAEALYTNQFEIHTSGVDFNAAFSVPLADGKLKFALNGTSVSSFMVKDAGIWSNYVGSSGWDWESPISGGGPVPRWKGSLFGGWENHDWAGGVTLRYTAGYQNGATLGGFGTTQLNVASYNAVDLNAEYRGLQNWRFSLSVVNLFNRQPPYDSAPLLFGFNTPYDPATYDDLGRMVDLHVTYKF